jgi:hypothetical protein
MYALRGKFADILELTGLEVMDSQWMLSVVWRLVVLEYLTDF